MNRYYSLIEKLIHIKDCHDLSRVDTEAINEACNALQKAGCKDEN